MTKSSKPAKAGKQTISAPLVVNKSVVFKPSVQVFEPLPDDNPCYRLIGLIAAETARIERLIDQAICNIGEMDLKVGACLTGQMTGAGPRFNALLQLATNRGMSEAILKRIKSLKRQAEPRFGDRNQVVHDAWVHERTTKEPHQFRGKARTNPKFGPEPVSATDLEDKLAKLRKHREDVNSLVSDIWTELRRI